jgi:hypothetical protein
MTMAADLDFNPWALERPASDIREVTFTDPKSKRAVTIWLQRPDPVTGSGAGEKAQPLIERYVVGSARKPPSLFGAPDGKKSIRLTRSIITTACMLEVMQCGEGGRELPEGAAKNWAWFLGFAVCMPEVWKQLLGAVDELLPADEKPEMGEDWAASAEPSCAPPSVVG